MKRPDGLSGVIVCVPAYGSNNTTHTTRSLYRTARFLTANGIDNEICDLSMDIVDARNTFLTFWYDGQPGCSHILMVDADMEYEPKLIEDMLAFDKPVVGCYYARRTMPASLVGRSFGGDILEDVVDGHLKVMGVGAGVLLIKRSAIDAMLAKMPELSSANIKYEPGYPTLEMYGGKRIIRAFDRITKDGVKLSEDLSFCERVYDSGGEVWANVNHIIGHHGMFNFAIRHMDLLENQSRKAA